MPSDVTESLGAGQQGVLPLEILPSESKWRKNQRDWCLAVIAPFVLVWLFRWVFGAADNDAELFGLLGASLIALPVFVFVRWRDSRAFARGCPPAGMQLNGRGLTHWHGTRKVFLAWHQVVRVKLPNSTSSWRSVVIIEDGWLGLGYRFNAGLLSAEQLCSLELALEKLDIPLVRRGKRFNDR